MFKVILPTSLIVPFSINESKYQCNSQNVIDVNNDTNRKH